MVGHSGWPLRGAEGVAHSLILLVAFPVLLVSCFVFNMLFFDAIVSFATLMQSTQAHSDTAAASKTFRDTCLAFKPEKHVRGSTRTRLEFISAGTTLNLDDNVPSCGRRSQVVRSDLCRVALQIPTSPRSSISFEIWLPIDWDENKRFLATGNGGVDGCKSA
jgi:hypothetical protein